MDKEKWIELFLRMNRANLMATLISILECKYTETELEIAYKEEVKNFDFWHEASNDLANGGNKESWLFAAQLLDSGVEI